MWVEIDLGQVRSVGGLALDTAGSPNDYPRGYAVNLSTDRDDWGAVARDDGNDGPLDVTFSPRPARYIHIEQTGQSDHWWWSIHEVRVEYAPEEDGGDEEPGPEPPQPAEPSLPEEPSPEPELPLEPPQPAEPPQPEEPQPEPPPPPEEETPPLSVRSSHYDARSGVDNILQAIDGDPETRWRSRIPQQPGMWFELDLHQVRSVGGLSLDGAGSPNDYPRGYVVRLSSDHNQWTEVARNEGNDQALDISFGSQPARYIRGEQTGSTDQWWWSIHGVTVKS
jgi:hypothetical protein